VGCQSRGCAAAGILSLVLTMLAFEGRHGMFHSSTDAAKRFLRSMFCASAKEALARVLTVRACLNFSRSRQSVEKVQQNHGVKFTHRFCQEAPQLVFERESI
jgi:hypothetical protein